ncbi:MAG: TRAP transporter large permease subunit [Deltaproteobacteria bacterium]|nr:TRAP transporter large permease subunit [Deltaproteobacteria bacterium]
MIEISPLMVVLLMFGGIFVGLAIGAPIAFVLGGLAVIFGFLGWGPSVWHLLAGRSYDSVTNYLLVAIPLFILMANFLEKSGIAEDLFKAMMYVFGPLNGGIALAVTVLCIVFAACTGIMGATVVSMSLMSMPIMMKNGYDKFLATGTICTGGSLGILIPPSIMLVMMADRSGISVGRLFAGAFIPGALLGILFIAYIAIVCWIDPSKGPALPLAERNAISTNEKIKLLLKNLVPPLILVAGVLGFIWTGVATPSEGAGVGAFLALLMMILYGKFTWRDFRDCVYSSFKGSCMVMTVIVGATCFTGVFIGLGGGQVVTDMILSFDFMGKWGMFFVMQFIVFILGFLIDWIGIIYITFPIFLPLANQLGFDPLWFIIIMSVNLQMSFITPPFGYALFYMKGTVQDWMKITLLDIYKGIIPFVVLQIVGLLICVIFPATSTWLPTFIK